MNHLDVQIIGVLPTADDPGEAFAYTIDAPTNLWIGALCEGGTRMGYSFMGYVLNRLIEADGFNEGDSVDVKDEAGAVVTATVGRRVPAGRVEAYQANSPTVRTVTATVTRKRPRRPRRPTPIKA